MHVALINTHYAPDLEGGAERSLKVLADGLVGRGVDVSVICLAAGERAGTEWIDGVRVVYLPAPGLRWPIAPDPRYPWRGLPAWAKPLWHIQESWSLAGRRRLLRVLDQLRPDLAHTNNLLGLSALCWGAIRSRGLPLVHTLRDYQLLCPRAQMIKAGSPCQRQCLACRLYAMTRKGASRRVDAVIGNSNFILQRHLDLGFFTGARVRRTIYNACEAPRLAHRAKTGGRGRPLQLGYLGKLIPAKGLHRLLDTLDTLLRDDRVNVVVAGAGDPRYERGLKGRLGSERVRFLGWVRPEVLFEQVDLLVVPSLWEEPLSRTLFEAYCHGLPVIATRRGGSPEVIDEGKTGYCYDPEQPEELRSLVASLIEQPSMLIELAQGAAAMAARFRPDRLVDDYLGLYAELTGR